MVAHRALGVTLSHTGAVASAQTHFTQGIALYDTQNTVPLRSSMARMLV